MSVAVAAAAPPPPPLSRVLNTFHSIRLKECSSSYPSGSTSHMFIERSLDVCIIVLTLLILPFKDSAGRPYAQRPLQNPNEKKVIKGQSFDRPLHWQLFTSPPRFRVRTGGVIDLLAG